MKNLSVIALFNFLISYFLSYFMLTTVSDDFAGVGMSSAYAGIYAIATVFLFIQFVDFYEVSGGELMRGILYTQIISLSVSAVVYLWLRFKLLENSSELIAVGSSYFLIAIFYGILSLYLIRYFVIRVHTRAYYARLRKLDEINYKSNQLRLKENFDLVLREYLQSGYDIYPGIVTGKTRHLTNREAYELLNQMYLDLESSYDHMDTLSRNNNGRLGASSFHHKSEEVKEGFYRACTILGLDERILKMIDGDSNLFNPFYEIVEHMQYIRNRRNALKLGLDGEMTVEHELLNFFDRERMLFGNRFKTISDGNVENDILVFTESGIYSLEVKNIMSSGERYIRISKDGLWYFKTNEDASWKYDEKSTNIFSQVNRQIYHTEKLLKTRLNRKVSLKSIIVIANDNVVIENESTWVIVRPNMLYSLMKPDSGTLIYDDADLFKMIEVLKNENIGEGKFEVIDFSESVNEIKYTLNFYSKFIEFSKRTIALVDNQNLDYRSQVTNDELKGVRI